ncbi:MAG TPA: hypothetical protein VK509_17330 [Polyangiales bacterium]|nr:hypothetical protein [Polyangiales bacterium]
MTAPSGASSTSATGSLLNKSNGTEDTGHYKVLYKGLNESISSEAYVFTGAYGTSADYCKIRSWARASGCTDSCDIEVLTLCFDKAGNRTNTQYVQTWGSFNPFE